MTTLNRSILAAAAAVLVTVGTLHTLQARRQREASVLRESNAGLVAEIYHRAEKPAAPASKVAEPTQRIDERTFRDRKRRAEFGQIQSVAVFRKQQQQIEHPAYRFWSFGPRLGIGGCHRCRSL